MPAKTSKRQLQAKSVSFSPDAKPAAKDKNPTTPPPPFTLAPPRLAPFLAQLDRSKVYIAHLDNFPWQFKRKIFAVPVALNLVIAALLLWRWWVVAPTYLAFFATAVGSRPHPSGSKKVLFSLLLWRVLMFCLDFALLTYIAPWPWSFFFEAPANPVSWRWIVGFQDAEIVVRRSRGWGSADLVGGAKKGHDSPFFKTRVVPAIDRGYVSAKTGYLMMGKDYELDFDGMITATLMVKDERLRLEDFGKIVLVFSEAQDAWLAWSVFELEDGVEQEERKKIVAFKVCVKVFVLFEMKGMV